MIDWKRVAELREEIGGEGLEEVVALFLEEAEAALSRIGPPDRLEAELHFLKGSAAILGFTDFGALCAAGEELARQGQSQLIDTGAIAAAFATSKEAFLTGLAAGRA